MNRFAKNEIPKIAIVGMDCILGNCKGLDNFERSIYEGNQHFINLPPNRWQGVYLEEKLLKNYGFESGKPPLGAYIEDLENEALSLQIQPEEVDKFNSQELLMLKVADNALKDARLHQGARLAVAIATATEAISDSENRLASYISSLWNFAGPSFKLNAKENSVFQALELAQKLLTVREVDAVLVSAVDLGGSYASVVQRNCTAQVNSGVNTLSYDKNVNGWMIGEGAAAVVLKLYDTAKQDSDRIYAVIDALSLCKDNSISDSQAVTQACQTAFNLAAIKPTDIGYLEVFGSGIQQQDKSEIEGLLSAYWTSEQNLTCAIGSVKANVGHTYAASGIVSLIKTALCLYHRYIPAVPQWSSPKNPEGWSFSPFYVACESRPWFLEKGATKRIAAINSMEIDGSYVHVILSEEPNQQQHSSKYLEQMPFYLFAIAADDQSTLLNQICSLQQTIENSSSLSAAASLNFTAFQEHQNATYTLAILGRNQDELTKEIQRAIQGVKVAFETGKDWLTPTGSYFTANPQGKLGKIAFVYSGSFTCYIGLARNLFRLFPQVYDDVIIKNVYSRVANVEKFFYPRSFKKLSTRQLEALEQQLLDNPIRMLESEMLFARLMTGILENYFQIKPQCVFGYSLGEISMMIAQGIWTSLSYQDGSDGLNSSALFKTRLSGPKNAVRENWGLPQKQDYQGEEFWKNYILLCPVSQVKEVIKHESRVYLILINTPQEVVIAGEAQACQRVIKTLNCNALPAPINHVIHCEPMHSEYNELVKVSTLPIQNVPETIFYSAAEYKPITLDSNTIGHNIATNLCQELDFARLINRVYEDGSRIFIEVGVGSNCSRWISENLKQKEHLTVSFNKRGIDDHTSIIKALAKLVSHRVDIDLSPLYSQTQKRSLSSLEVPKNYTPSQPRVKNIALENTDKDTAAKSFDRLNNKPQSRYLDLMDLKEFTKMNPSLIPNYIKTSVHGFINAETQQNEIAVKNGNIFTSLPLPTGNAQSVEKPQVYTNFLTEHENGKYNLPSSTNSNLVNEVYLSDLHSPYYQRLSENASRITKSHAIFLQTRQDSLQQMSNIIKLQMSCIQNLYQ
ncbi:type I polyketide synthase [Nostoc sp. CENA67]|uniref:Type I polyketide synthase n=1 Tax=Amazonocrinis nigriterrae CENA67 TaxID=2794033 RepID=A0A8J7HVC5_9NOST|nr:type I polyketide synthase [Amazonocrinis nigriterrae]MBH8564125.1 type I polyketide synthase [Amazonocrinis nigriterrae CENA67]